jgi:acyl-CoA thioesterase-2
MADYWNDLLSCLELRPPAAGEQGGDGADRVFEGANQALPYHRVFGGQVLAQSLRAAALTCPDKSVKSMHSLFPREGRADEPMRYDVRVLHEGRSFAALTVVASQSRGVVATATVSMHVPEDGIEQQTVEPVGPVFDADLRVEMELIPWETRAAVDLDATDAGTPEYELWMRSPQVEADLTVPLFGYATDLTLIGTALRPIDGFGQRGNGTTFTSAVTSHTLWFHRPFRMDEWLLLRQHSPLVAHGRCFGRGDALTENGVLVASFAQEALLRLPPAQ